MKLVISMLTGAWFEDGCHQADIYAEWVEDDTAEEVIANFDRGGSIWELRDEEGVLIKTNIDPTSNLTLLPLMQVLDVPIVYRKEEVL